MPVRLSYSIKEKTNIRKYYNEKDRHLTVFLKDEAEPTGIHCIYCKKKLFECQHQVLQITPGSPPQHLNHIKIKCSNPGCNTYYYFVSIV